MKEKKSSSGDQENKDTTCYKYKEQGHIKIIFS